MLGSGQTVHGHGGEGDVVVDGQHVDGAQVLDAVLVLQEVGAVDGDSVRLIGAEDLHLPGEPVLLTLSARSPSNPWGRVSGLDTFKASTETTQYRVALKLLSSNDTCILYFLYPDLVKEKDYLYGARSQSPQAFFDLM